jgi:hypothetical protein
MHIKTFNAATDEKGANLKHGSYERYLASKKAGHLRTKEKTMQPKQGNKTRMYGMLANCKC